MVTPTAMHLFHGAPLSAMGLEESFADSQILEPEAEELAAFETCPPPAVASTPQSAAQRFASRIAAATLPLAITGCTISELPLGVKILIGGAVTILPPAVIVLKSIKGRQDIRKSHELAERYFGSRFTSTLSRLETSNLPSTNLLRKMLQREVDEMLAAAKQINVIQTSRTPLEQDNLVRELINSLLFNDAFTHTENQENRVRLLTLLGLAQADPEYFGCDCAEIATCFGRNASNLAMANLRHLTGPEGIPYAQNFLYYLGATRKVMFVEKHRDWERTRELINQDIRMCEAYFQPENRHATRQPYHRVETFKAAHFVLAMARKFPSLFEGDPQLQLKNLLRKIEESNWHNAKLEDLLRKATEELSKHTPGALV